MYIVLCSFEHVFRFMTILLVRFFGSQCGSTLYELLCYCECFDSWALGYTRSHCSLLETEAKCFI
uniref:Secreted protein n=1 Tax=Anguilla anguilla TaxID=7936 RepID=A0A0E9WQN5_ANGAN